LRAHQELVQLPVGAGTDLLGQKRPSRTKNPGNLCPEGEDRMATGDRLEAGRAERKPAAVVRPDHVPE
jgi:hypothetical protein